MLWGASTASKAPRVEWARSGAARHRAAKFPRAARHQERSEDLCVLGAAQLWCVVLTVPPRCHGKLRWVELEDAVGDLVEVEEESLDFRGCHIGPTESVHQLTSMRNSKPYTPSILGKKKSFWITIRSPEHNFDFLFL